MMLRVIGFIILAFFLLRAAPTAYPYLGLSAVGGALIAYGRPIISLDIHRHFNYTVDDLLGFLHANRAIS